MVVDGKTYWWCPKYVDKSGKGCWNGMYVTHKPEDHDAIIAKRYRNREPAGQTGGTGGASSSGNNLVVSQKLQEVLCSKLMLSNADAGNICNDVCSQGKD